MINQNIDMSSAITLHRLLTFAFVTLMTDESSTLAEERQGEICLCFCLHDKKRGSFKLA